MNKELLESQWVQAKEYIRSKWDHITDEDIRQINGRYDQLVAKLQQRYGMTREEAEDEIRRFTFDRNVKPQDRSFSRSMREEDVRRSDSSSLFKWLLFAGIPLALLAAWFAHHEDTTAMNPTTPTTTRETVVNVPNDQLILRDIQTHFARSGAIGSDLTNVRINSINGIVTVQGTVPSAEVRDTLLRDIKAINGVKDVNNQLQVLPVAK